MERARLLSRFLRGLALAAAFVTSAVEAAEAHERRVVVIDVDPRVADALVVALSPWSLTVVPTPGPSPAPDFDAASARARTLASEQHAGAVVWIAAPRAPDTEATLWVYDAQTLQLAVRPLTVAAPFDDAGAAAVALSVKTILRASPLAAPEPQRPRPLPRPPRPRRRSSPRRSRRRRSPSGVSRPSSACVPRRERAPRSSRARRWARAYGPRSSGGMAGPVWRSRPDRASPWGRRCSRASCARPRSR